MQKTVKFENRAFIPSRFKEKSHIYEHCGRKQSVKSKDHSANGGKINGTAVIFFTSNIADIHTAITSPAANKGTGFTEKDIPVELSSFVNSREPHSQMSKAADAAETRAFVTLSLFLSDSGIMIRNMAVSVIIPDCTPVLMRQKLAEKTEKAQIPTRAF